MLFKKFFKNLFSKILRVKESEGTEFVEDEREYESQYLDDEEEE